MDRKLLLPSTDIRRCLSHWQMVSQVEQLIEMYSEALGLDKGVPTQSVCIDFLKSDERLTIINLLMHLSDISNPVKPFSVYQKWAGCVLTEFFRQVRIHYDYQL